MDVILVTGPAGQTGLTGQFVRPVVQVPQVDWQQETVLVVDMGEQRTAGYGVTIEHSRLTPAGEIQLLLHIRRPGRGAFVAQVLTHPYAVATIPRTWLKAEGVTVVGLDQHGVEVLRQVVKP